MQKAEQQHNHAQNQPAQRQGRGASLESPQGEQIAQLEAMADVSPQVKKLAQLAAMANNSPSIAAQRKAISAIHDSPQVTAQRRQLDSLTGETAQREEAEEPLQAKVTQREAAPAKPNNTGLPDNLKSGIESLSGMSMDNVRVHYNSSQPAQLNALAYAQGTDIHVAPGQEQHLPHEAWHVVQQAQGRVQPTMQMKEGVPVNDDAGLEHEADVMGARAASVGVAQGKSKSDPIDSAPEKSMTPVDSAHEGVNPIQRAVETGGGIFDTQLYEPIRDGYAVGADIKLTFMPKKELTEKFVKVGMVQINRRIQHIGEKKGLDVTKEQAKRTTEDGWAIDRTDWSEEKDFQGFGMRNNNPIYQSQENAPPDTEEGRKMRMSQSLYDTGDEPKGRGRTWSAGEEAPALLIDSPRSMSPAYAKYEKITDEFETAAMELTTGTYLGTVKWGWEADSKKVSLAPPDITLASEGNPTLDFLKAAVKWNQQEMDNYTDPESSEVHKVAPIELPLPKK